MPAKLGAAVRSFLEEPNPAVLATVSPTGRPQATPVWFMLDGDNIIVNTSHGREKLKNLEDHPHLALVVVDPKNMYRYVQIRGRVARFDHEAGAGDIDRLSLRYTGKPYDYGYGGGPEDRVTLVICPLGVNSMGIR